jgi:hypothetical protein
MLEPYYRINEALGISIYIPQDGSMQIRACEIVIKESKLDIKKKLVDIATADDLKKHFAVKALIALNLSGKGILHKQIERIGDVNAANFSLILPNASFEDFYIQNFASGNKSFISIIRKSEADKWIDFITKQGFIPLTLSLGPFPVQNIVSQLNVYEGELIFDGHNIQRNEQTEWLAYHYKESSTAPFTLKIESEQIDEKLVVAYASVFQMVLAANLNIIRANVNSITTKFEDHIATKKIKVKGMLILLVFFALLLINFFLFSWLTSANNKLTDQASVSDQSTNDIQGISEQVNDKEALLKTLGWDGGINKSLLVDQLASLLPAKISWREITINPTDQSTGRAQKLLQFMDGKIRVVGNADRIIPVNEWIARVKTKKWVKNIQLDSYTYNNELNTGQFTVIIDY